MASSGVLRHKGQHAWSSRQSHWAPGVPGLAVPERCVRRSPRFFQAPSASDASSSSSSSSQPSDADGLERLVFLPGGQAVSMTSRRRRTELWPELHMSRADALQQQLEALQQNNTPYVDHGVEVLYRFANFDPFNPRTRYFGRQFDLGQFERFRRIVHTPPFRTLLGHKSSEIRSSLEVSEHVWVARVAVTGDSAAEEALYEFTMVQRLGGVYDGYWFSESLVADGNDWQWMRSQPGQAV